MSAAEKRVFYPTKAAWAAARAGELEQQAMELGAMRGGDWRTRQTRRNSAARLRDEASRYRRMAISYEARGR